MPTTMLATPIGPVLIETTADRITGIRIGADADGSDDADHPLLAAAAEQLRGYFTGDRTDFDLPLAESRTLRGGALRAAIVGVGHGETASYGALAGSIGSSARAVGQACARNPFPIVVPCHRVTGAGGAIGHYSAGAGIDTKRWLLNHERRT